ncbi:radical SAM protein [Dehalogenimonas sp. THU2]|uniref:radical SAM protein n=1 Tax=Dehalogenimonas sp. THU2 TaxID=3151121 RepID=UPI0032182572
MMNVFHITYEPQYKILDLHFWGCNLKCRGCYKNYDVFDLGLTENPLERLLSLPEASPPTRFLKFDEVLNHIKSINPEYTIFMGQEAVLDAELPLLAAAIHETTKSRIILLTNGLKMADLTHVDEVVFSFKAFNDDVHKQYTGGSNAQILTNFKKLYASGAPVQAEIAYIPGLVEEKEIEDLARYLAGIDADVPFRVTSYFAVPGAPWKPAGKDQVEKAAIRARLHLRNVTTITSDMKSSSWKPVRIF